MTNCRYRVHSACKSWPRIDALICIDESRKLELRDIPAPPTPAPGYGTVKIDVAAINRITGPAIEDGASSSRHIKEVHGNVAGGPGP